MGRQTLSIKRARNCESFFNTNLVLRVICDVDVAILTDSDREAFEEKNSWYPYFMNIKKDGIVLYEH